MLLCKSPQLVRQSGLECVPVDLDARKPRVQVILVICSQLRRNVDPQPPEDGEPLVPDVLAVGAAHNIVDGVVAGRKDKQVLTVRPQHHLQLAQGNARENGFLVLGFADRELVAADGARRAYATLRVQI